MTDTLLRFGRFELDVVGRALRADGQPVLVEQRPIDLLVQLARQHHRVVSCEELREKVWQGRGVSNSSLARAVMKLRQAIGDTGGTPLIRTVPKVGYQFVAPLTSAAAVPALLAPAETLTLALLPFENATGNAALDWVALGLMTMAAEALARDRRLSLVETRSLLGALAAQDDSAIADRVATVQRNTGAQWVVHGRIARTGTGYRLDFRLHGQAHVPMGSVAAARPIELAAGLARELSQTLFRETHSAAPAPVSFRDPMAGEAYARGLQMAAGQCWMPALNLYRMALDLEPGHPEVKLDLLLALSLNATDDAEVEALSAELLASSECMADPAVAASVHQAVGRFHVNRHAHGPADHHLRLALQLGDGCQSYDWTAQTLLLMCTMFFHQRRFAETRECIERARELCEHSGNRVLALGVLNVDACLASLEGQHERYVELSLELARRARALRAHHYLCNASANASQGLGQLGRLDEAAICAEESFAAAVAMNDRYSIDAGAMDACTIYRLAGAPQASARLLAELDKVQSPVHQENAVCCARGLHAAASGDPQEAARCFAAALQLERDAGHAWLEPTILPWLIEALILSDRLDEAQVQIQHAAELAADGNQELEVQLLLGRAVLAHRQARPDAALGFLEQVMATRASPLWRTWACADAAWLLAEAGDAMAAAAWLARIDASLATLPLVLAAKARVLHAMGDVVAAYRTHLHCLAGRNAGTGNDYFARLDEFYAGHANGTLTASVLPRAPALPSRL